MNLYINLNFLFLHENISKLRFYHSKNNLFINLKRYNTLNNN